MGAAGMMMTLAGRPMLLTILDSSSPPPLLLLLLLLTTMTQGATLTLRGGRQQH